MDIPKVLGGCSPDAVELASLMYGTIFRRVVPVSSPSVAEMTKLLENIYRCVNIALVNELKQLCMKMGIDIHEVIDAAKTKPFGFQAFYPGPAWAAIAFLSIPSISPGRRSSLTSAHASSSWPAN
jgi:UDP-N-acetyl-D-glucosamine dehydrogenase